MKAVILGVALLIDLLQATISAGLFALSSAPGTIVGAAGGCYIGASIAGKIGCFFLGGLAGFVGSFANPFLAPFTIPLGIAAGFAINVCLSATLGSGLIFLLATNGMWYPDLIFGGGIVELIPGLDDLPGWTVMAGLCILRKKAKEKPGSVLAVAGGAAGVIAAVAEGNAAGVVQSGAQALQGVKQFNQARAREGDMYTQENQEAQGEYQRRNIARELKNIDGIRAKAPVGAAGAAALALVLFFGVQSVHAQSVSSLSSGQVAPVQYVVASETPGPNEVVGIQAQGVGNFLGNSTLTWKENGTTVEQGVGKSTFTFTTGAIGQAIDIHLEIDSSEEGTIMHDFVFNPSLVDLVWEAGTYTPPLYLGKPLYSAGAPLRVVAFPVVMQSGALVPASRLSFQWQENGTPVPAQSGLGADSLDWSGNELQNGEEASVDVYLGQTKVAHGDISVPVNQPQVVLYYHDPLRGELMDDALPAAITLKQNQFTIQAEPYYFAQSSVQNGGLAWSWQLNGQDTTGPQSGQGILTLRQSGTGAGAAQVSVSAQDTNTASFIAQASAALQIIFGGSANSTSTSLFGI